MLGEMTEIAITRDEGDVMIDAGLRDQDIRHLWLKAASEQKAASLSGTQPISIRYIEQRPIGDDRLQHGAALVVAQQLSKNHRRQTDLSML